MAAAVGSGSSSWRVSPAFKAAVRVEERYLSLKYEGIVITAWLITSSDFPLALR